jgi:hypothetical protein
MRERVARCHPWALFRGALPAMGRVSPHFEGPRLSGPGSDQKHQPPMAALATHSRASLQSSPAIPPLVTNCVPTTPAAEWSEASVTFLTPEPAKLQPRRQGPRPTSAQHAGHRLDGGIRARPACRPGGRRQDAPPLGAPREPRPRPVASDSRCRAIIPRHASPRNGPGLEAEFWPVPATSLQWGRGRMTAESPRATDSAPLAPGFNGAAVA